MIATKRIEKQYGDGDARVIALSGVSIDIEREEYVAIVGKSGSGKSTLLHTIAGLLRPTAGNVIVDDIDLYADLDDTGLARFRSEYVGFVFQAFNLVPYLTAYENTVLPLAHLGLSKKVKREMAEAALGAVELTDRASHLPSELSGGQQQRVAIARAIVNNPLIIAADEPTGNLDLSTRAEIMDLFTELNGGGHTIVMVTHDPENIERAGRTIRIADGRIVEDSSDVAEVAGRAVEV